MSVRVYIPDSPFAPPRHVAPERWDYADCKAGQTVRAICGDAPIHAWMDGRELSELAINGSRLKDGTEITVRPVPQAGLTLAAASAIAAGAASAGGAAGLGLPALPIGLSRVLT